MPGIINQETIANLALIHNEFAASTGTANSHLRPKASPVEYGSHSTPRVWSGRDPESARQAMASL